MEQMRIIITGGGTGGHLFPGIALAEGMRERFNDCEIMFIGTDRAIDDRALQGRSYIIKSLKCRGLKGKGLAQRIGSAAMLPGAVFKALQIIRRFRPALVFGVGGYVTGPVLSAARIAGVPVCIHEQNSVPGLANRMLARIANRIFLSLPVDMPLFQGDKSLLCGNPVRRELIDAAAATHPNSETPTLLVLGGSQGARPLNEIMLAAAPLIEASLGGAWQLIHQTGAADLDQVREGYAANGIRATVQDFFTDMAALYSEADLVLSRAGATTLAELAIMGLPALLVPYPFAADNHQDRNGGYYVNADAAKMFIQQDLTAEKLTKHIVELLHNRNRLAIMGQNMQGMGQPNATENIITECLKLIQG